MTALDLIAEADRLSLTLLDDLRARRIRAVNIEIIEQRVSQVVPRGEPGWKALVDRTVRRCVERVSDR